MSRRKWWVVVFIVIGAVAIGIAGEVYGWPIVRTAGYGVLVDEYAHATPMRSTHGENQTYSEWRFEHSLSSGTTVRIQADDFMDVVKVHYRDESKAHDLYRYVDYSSPISLRTAGDILYVYWGEALIHSDHWLLAYDLARRREIDRRRVDPHDIGIVTRVQSSSRP